MATLAESFLADLEDLSDVEDEEQQEQQQEDEEGRGLLWRCLPSCCCPVAP